MTNRQKRDEYVRYTDQSPVFRGYAHMLHAAKTRPMIDSLMQVITADRNLTRGQLKALSITATACYTMLPRRHQIDAAAAELPPWWPALRAILTDGDENPLDNPEL